MARFGAISADTVSPARDRRARGCRTVTARVPLTASSRSGPEITDCRRSVRYIGGSGWAIRAAIRQAGPISSAVEILGCLVFRLPLPLPRLNLDPNDFGVSRDETFGAATGAGRD